MRPCPGRQDRAVPLRHAVPKGATFFLKTPLFLPMPPLAPMLVRRLPMCLPFPYAMKAPKTAWLPCTRFPKSTAFFSKSHFSTLNPSFFYAPGQMFPHGFPCSCRFPYRCADPLHASQLPCFLSALILHVAPMRAESPMGNQSPCLKIPTLRIFPHPKNPHRETQPCDTSWWTAARNSGRRHVRPACRNGAGDGRRGIGGPAVGVPAMTDTKRCLPIWSANRPTVSGRHDTGPPLSGPPEWRRRWPGRYMVQSIGCTGNGAAGTVPGITAPGMVPPSMVPPDIVPPIGGTILGGTVLGGTWCGAGYGRHGVWCLLSEARGVVPAMAGTVPGRRWAARFRGLSVRPANRPGGGGNEPPIRSGRRPVVRRQLPAGTCRRGDRPGGGGGGGRALRGLAKDARGRPGSGLPIGRPVWCLLWQVRCWPGTVSRVPGGAWERCLSIRDEASAETPEKRYLANEETVRNGSGERGRENEAGQCLKSGQHGNAEISGKQYLGTVCLGTVRTSRNARMSGNEVVGSYKISKKEQGEK